jgi:hypothetical protein
MTLTRGFIRNAVTTPLDARLMDMAKFVANADGSPRTGVLGGANASIVSTTATMFVAIAAAEFVTSKGKADGVAVFTNDGVVNVPITTAPASNSRIDVIYVKHNDDTTGDANATPIFAVAAGIAAASPGKPAIPTGALELATLRVYSGTTATNGGANLLTNTYQMTAARGGRVPFRTKADLDLWTTAAEGQDVNVIANARLYARNAGAWVLIFGALAVGVLGLDSNMTASWTRLTKDSDGMVDVSGTVIRTNGTTFVASRVVCVLPVGFRPTEDAVGQALTFGSGTNMGLIARSTGPCEIPAASPTGHTVAIFSARFQGTP